MATAVNQLKPTMWAPGLNMSHPLTNGLVFAMPFLSPQATGTYRDLSGNGNNGTSVGVFGLTTTEVGAALDFDGTNDSIDCGAGASLNITGGLTIIVYIVPDVTSSHRVLSKANSVGVSPYLQYHVGFPSNDKYYLVIDKAGTLTEAVVETTANLGISAGNLYHITTTWDNTVGKIYVGGVLKKTNNPGAGAIGSHPTWKLMLGKSDYLAAQRFNGRFLGAWIYNRALTAGEVAELAADPWAMFRPPRTL